SRLVRWKNSYSPHATTTSAISTMTKATAPTRKSPSESVMLRDVAAASFDTTSPSTAKLKKRPKTMRRAYAYPARTAAWRCDRPTYRPDGSSASWSAIATYLICKDAAARFRGLQGRTSVSRTLPRVRGAGKPDVDVVPTVRRTRRPTPCDLGRSGLPGNPSMVGWRGEHHRESWAAATAAHRVHCPDWSRGRL